MKKTVILYIAIVVVGFFAPILITIILRGQETKQGTIDDGMLLKVDSDSYQSLHPEAFPKKKVVPFSSWTYSGDEILVVAPRGQAAEFFILKPATGGYLIVVGDGYRLEQIDERTYRVVK